MNGNWQINRVGLIDFWYYDEEEFDFLDGRMLLRGANGSGKSVTMQSFIPLLLDGNMNTLCLLQTEDGRHPRIFSYRFEFQTEQSITGLVLRSG